MAYRVCVSFIPQSFNLEDPLKWEGDQVHAEYIKATDYEGYSIDDGKAQVLINRWKGISILITNIQVKSAFDIWFGSERQKILQNSYGKTPAK